MTARRERQAFRGPHCPWLRPPPPCNPLPTPKVLRRGRRGCRAAQALLGDTIWGLTTPIRRRREAAARSGSTAVIRLEVIGDGLGVAVADRGPEDLDHLGDLRVP